MKTQFISIFTGSDEGSDLTLERAVLVETDKTQEAFENDYAEAKREYASGRPGQFYDFDALLDIVRSKGHNVQVQDFLQIRL